jgi:hypothetical protein
VGVHHHITSAMVIEIKIVDLDQLDLSNSLLVQHITKNQFNGKLMLQRTTKKEKFTSPYAFQVLTSENLKNVRLIDNLGTINVRIISVVHRCNIVVLTLFGSTLKS